MLIDSSHVTTIAVLSSAPYDKSPLYTDLEARKIVERIRRSKRRDHFSLVHQTAVRPQVLRQVLLDYKPHIIHFSGHGSADGLFFQGEGHTSHLVTTESLVGLFVLFAEPLKCIVLNACHSRKQIVALAKHTKRFVIGMNGLVEDEWAIEFATGFYDALGAGADIPFAYRLGCNAVELAGGNRATLPTLSGPPGLQFKRSAKPCVTHRRRRIRSGVRRISCCVDVASLRAADRPQLLPE